MMGNTTDITMASANTASVGRSQTIARQRAPTVRRVRISVVRPPRPYRMRDPAYRALPNLSASLLAVRRRLSGVRGSRLTTARRLDIKIGDIRDFGVAGAYELLGCGPWLSTVLGSLRAASDLPRASRFSSTPSARI